MKSKKEVEYLSARVEELEGQLQQARQALSKCAAVLGGYTMSKQTLVDALEAARAALGEEKQL